MYKMILKDCKQIKLIRKVRYFVEESTNLLKWREEEDTRVVFTQIVRVDMKAYIHFITKCLLKDNVAVVEYLSQCIPTTTKFYDIICHIQCCKCCLFLYNVLFKVVNCVWRSRPWISATSKVESFLNIAHTRITLVISWLFANVLIKGILLLIWMTLKFLN